MTNFANLSKIFEKNFGLIFLVISLIIFFNLLLILFLITALPNFFFATKLIFNCLEFKLSIFTVLIKIYYL